MKGGQQYPDTNLSTHIGNYAAESCYVVICLGV